MYRTLVAHGVRIEVGAPCEPRGALVTLSPPLTQWPEKLIHGAPLDALIRRTKILLVIRAFSNPTEFKMTRLMVGFAHEAYVLVAG